MDDTHSKIRNIDKDTVMANRWLKRTGLKAKTEELIIATQEQSLITKNYQENTQKKKKTRIKPNMLTVPTKKLNKLTS